jgi:hypothetical protein
MKTPILVLAFGIALSATLPARAEILEGDRFITAMKDDTVSGRTAAGAAYNLYFLRAARLPTAMRSATAIAAVGGWTGSAMSA